MFRRTRPRGAVAGRLPRRGAVRLSGKWTGGTQGPEVVDDLTGQHEQVSDLGLGEALARALVGVGGAGHQRLLQRGAGRGEKDVDLATVGGIAHAGDELRRLERVEDRGRRRHLDADAARQLGLGEAVLHPQVPQVLKLAEGDAVDRELRGQVAVERRVGIAQQHADAGLGRARGRPAQPLRLFRRLPLLPRRHLSAPLIIRYHMIWYHDQDMSA